MSFSIGQPVPLRVLVSTADGELDDASAAVLTVTRPDGTVDTPTVTHVGDGTYHVDYSPVAAGLHLVQWTMTGANASAPPVDSFYVDPITLPPLASLAEGRRQCRLGSTDDDTELQRMLMVASSICERRTRIWRRQILTLTTSGDVETLRLRRPVRSITSVVEDGTAVTSDGWTLATEAGLLHRGTTTYRQRWACGRENIVVTYVAGPADGLVPEEIRQGVLLLTQHLWDNQRGGSGLPRKQGADFSLPVGFTIPNAVMEHWDPWIPELVA